MLSDPTSSPGRSTSAAPTCRTRRCRCPSRSCRRRAGRPSSSTSASCPTRRATISSNPPTSREPDTLEAEAHRTRQARCAIALDSATAADALSRMITTAGGKPVRGNDPVAAAQGGQEHHGDRRHAHRAPARRRRRWRASSPGSTARRPTGARRDRRRRGAGDVSPPDRRAARRLLLHDFRNRAERRHRALPRHPQDQPAHRARRFALLIDSGAQYQDGTTDVTRTIPIGTPTRGDARPLHARAEGHIAIARARFPDGTTRRAARRASRGSLCGRPGSTSRTAPATASAPISRCMRARSAFRRPAPTSR